MQYTTLVSIVFQSLIIANHTHAQCTFCLTCFCSAFSQLSRISCMSELWCACPLWHCHSSLWSALGNVGSLWRGTYGVSCLVFRRPGPFVPVNLLWLYDPGCLVTLTHPGITLSRMGSGLELRFLEASSGSFSLDVWGKKLTGNARPSLSSSAYVYRKIVPFSHPMKNLGLLTVVH